MCFSLLLLLLWNPFSSITWCQHTEIEIELSHSVWTEELFQLIGRRRINSDKDDHKLIMSLSLSFQFYSLLERDISANNTIMYRQCTLFAPTNRAFQRYPELKVKASVHYHLGEYRQRESQKKLRFMSAIHSSSSSTHSKCRGDTWPAGQDNYLRFWQQSSAVHHTEAGQRQGGDLRQQCPSYPQQVEQNRTQYQGKANGEWKGMDELFTSSSR